MTAPKTFASVPFTSVGARSLGKPAAVFPGGTASDQNLIIAVDRQQTKLASILTATDTTMTVADASMITANNLLSIDNEIVRTTAAPTGASVPIARGFDGTTPALHLSGAPVSGFIDAYHHNTLVAEIEAIEQTLGPNLINVPSSALITAPAYDFPPQSPGGSLTVGTNAITLSPVPRGVNGSDTNHYLYVTGGTGTPEAVRITGGSAVSGAASGQIFVTCASAHSGAWVIRSATAGAQEAHNHAVGPVVFPAGTFEWYGPLWSNGNLTVEGGGCWVTTLHFNTPTLKMFDIERDNFILRDFTLHYPPTAPVPVAGNMGIYTAGNGSSAAGAAANNGVIEDVIVGGFWNGIYTDGGGGSIDLNRVQVNNCKADGIVCRETQGYWTNIQVLNNEGNGMTLLKPTGTTGGVPPFFSGLQTYGNQGWGLSSICTLQISGTPSFFNNDKAGEIYLKAQELLGGWIKDASVQWAGDTPFFGKNLTAPSILLDTACGPVLLDNVQIIGGQGSGVVIRSSSHVLVNMYVSGCGAGAQAGNMYELDVTACSSAMIADNEFRGFSHFSSMGSENLLTGNYFIANSATQTTVDIVDGLDWRIVNNHFLNVGGGSALAIEGGVEYMKGANMVTGTFTNLGHLSSRSHDLT